MSERLNSPTLPPTLEELKRRGDKLMADAKQAVIESRQMLEESRRMREWIKRHG